MEVSVSGFHPNDPPDSPNSGQESYSLLTPSKTPSYPPNSTTKITKEMLTATPFIPKVYKTQNYVPEHAAICKNLLAYIVGPDGHHMKIRIILDGASEITILRKSIADYIGLTGTPCVLRMVVSGGDQKTVFGQREVKFSLKSIDGKYHSPLISGCTAPKISEPLHPLNISPWKYEHLKKLTYTECLPQNKLGKKELIPDLLIGEPVYSHLIPENIKPNPIKGSDDFHEPSAMITKLGICLCGAYPKDESLNSEVRSHSIFRAIVLQTKIWNPEQSFVLKKLASYVDPDADIKSLSDIELLWNLEKIGIECDDNSQYTHDEQAAVTLMQEKTKFDKENRRWTTSLLWKGSKINFTNETRALAVARSLEKKCLKKSSDMERLNCALNEFVKNDFLTEASQSEIRLKRNMVTGHHHYLQFHAVINEDRSTKTRIVINAAAEGEDGTSLNSHLYPGPVMLPSLLILLIKFRYGKIAYSCDLSKCYLRTHLDKESQQFLRLKWRWGQEDQPFKDWIFRRLAFGISSAPFQSSWIIRENASLFDEKYPLESSIIKSQTYVDDLVASHNSPIGTRKIIKNILEIFANGGYETHKFISNSKFVLKDVPEELKSKETTQKILGCQWNSTLDTLEFPFLTELRKKEKNPFHIVSRRYALSITSSIFDPQGLLSPVTMAGRQIIQDSWKIKNLKWDSEFPIDLKRRVEEFESQLPLLTSFSQPRCLVKDGYKPKMLACFSDGSDLGYSAVIYLVSEKVLEDKTISRDARLCFAKSRVAPVSHPLSTPKMEILGAILAIRSSILVKKALDISNVHFWTDSLITLHRIRKNPAIFKLWISNRLTEIRNHSTPDQWWWCSSSDNHSADLASRGSTIKNLLQDTQWWNAPNFLISGEPWKKPTAYTNELREMDSFEIPHSRKFDKIAKVHATMTEKNPKVELFHLFFNRYESWRSTINMFCYLFRFLNWKFGEKYPWNWKEKDFIDIEEFRKCELFCFSITQRENFPEEFKMLKSGKNFEQLPKNSQLVPLLPFFDHTNDVIRMKSRLRYSHLVCMSIDPVILPKKSNVVTKYVKWIHLIHLHTPTETTIANVRFVAWLISSRRSVKNILFGCNCRKYSHARNFNQQCAPLPLERLGLNEKLQLDFLPFRYISCDFAGPVFPDKLGPHYILIFSCMQTRAIYVTLNHDLSTFTFIQSLRQLVARNGAPSYILSDHFSSLHAADRYLKKVLKQINWSNVKNWSQKSSTKWIFSTQYSPWKNAVSEVMVSLLKKSLRFCLRSAKIDYYEMVTLLCEIEQIVNSRSLSYISDNDSSEMGPITPFMLARGRPAALYPDLPYKQKVEDHPISKKMLHRRRMLDSFEKRWKKSYLSQLCLTKKWRNLPKLPIQEGLQVILKDDSLKMSRNQWKCGIIDKCHKSSDGQTRTCTVRVYNPKNQKISYLQRSVQKLSCMEHSLIELQ